MILYAPSPLIIQGKTDIDISVSSEPAFPYYRILYEKVHRPTFVRNNCKTVLGGWSKNFNFCLVHSVTRSHPIYGPTIVQICLWYPFRTTYIATFADQKSPLSETLIETSTLTLISHCTLRYKACDTQIFFIFCYVYFLLKFLVF